MMTTPHHLALTFDSWFPFDESDDEEMREMYRDGFARAKLTVYTARIEHSARSF